MSAIRKLSKSAHFFPCDRTYAYNKMTRLYMDNIMRGVSMYNVSDRDPRFTSMFWSSVQNSLGSKLTMNTTYYPQTDVQTERTIQTLEDMLR